MWKDGKNCEYVDEMHVLLYQLSDMNRVMWE